MVANGEFGFLYGGAAGKIHQMIEDCKNVRHVEKCRGGPGFSEWEQEFLDNVDRQFGRKGELSEKQVEKLTQMWDRI